MHTLLFFRRLRRSFRLWQQSRQVCSMCGRPVERFEFVCAAESCQLRALGDQALLAVELPEAPRSPGRVVHAKAEPVSAGLPACA